MLVSAAWIGPAILGAVNEVAQRRLNGDDPPALGALLFASGDWLVYAALTPAVFAISRTWPIARPHVVRSAALHFSISLVFCVAWAAAGAVLRAVLMPEALYGGFAMHLVSWLFITLPFGVSVYLAVVGIEHAIRYFVEARDRELQMARLSDQLSTARFAALQAQVNPHFLFNTLNTIAVLVRDDDKRGATRIVEQLADVLRRTLSRHRANEVRLEEELDLARQYLAIEQARFPDRLLSSFEIDDALLSAAVPSFALQHLVENAVRHGIAKRAEGGRITVMASRSHDVLTISVSNDGPSFDDASRSAQGGLANTRERLQALYGDRASLVVSSVGGITTAVLRVPYRELVSEVPDADR